MKYLALGNLFNLSLQYLSLSSQMTASGMPAGPRAVNGSLANAQSTPPAFTRLLVGPGQGLGNGVASGAASGSTIRPRFVRSASPPAEHASAGARAPRHARGLHNLNDAEIAMRHLTLEEFLRRYMELATMYSADSAPLRSPNSQPAYLADDFANSMRHVYRNDWHSELDMERLQAVEAAAGQFAQDVRYSGEVAVYRRPDLAPYIRRVIDKATDRAVVAILGSYDPAPYWSPTEVMIEEAQSLHDLEMANLEAREQARTEASVKAEIDRMYAVEPGSSLLAVPFRSSPELRQLALQVLTFKGDDALNKALEFAPRATELRSAGFLGALRRQLGPLGRDQDRYAVVTVKYQNPDFKYATHGFSFDEDRFQPVAIVRKPGEQYGVYSLDGGATWKPNPYETNDAREEAKAKAASDLIAKARAFYRAL